jgi:putative nucleotidyltransferase with HDIG domain
MSLELKKALYHISSLSDLSQEINSEDNFLTKIRSVLYVLMGTFLANKGAIFWHNRNKGKLVLVAHKGFDEHSFPRLRIRLDRMLPLAKNEPFRLGDGKEILSGTLQDALVRAGANLLIPLWVRDEFIGVIIVSGKFTDEPYRSEDLEILRAVANQVAITINNHSLFVNLSEQLEKNRHLYEEMRRIYHDTIQAFAAAIDAKDVYTKNHSQRVAKYAVAIARELGWDESDVEGIYIAGFLHDVGKIVISSEVLNKKDNLTERDLEELRKHPVLSSRIISKIRFPWKDVVKNIRHHHERVDGRGYPSALTGDDISEGAKILTLADSFDAMTTDRPYRSKKDLEEALEELKNCLGTQFDSRIVAAFCKVLEKEIKGTLPEPNILPHLDKDFEPSVITGLLEGLIQELSE